VIKYLGSKRRLLPTLLQQVAQLDAPRTFLDVFSGTSRVGHAMKAHGLQVRANDHNAYAHTLAQCYVAADRDRVLGPVQRVIEELQSLPGRPGYVTETFCERSRFFHPKNGARIDAMRDRIDELDLPQEVRAVVLVSLMEAADRVDSTTGVQMAYLKQWAPRALGDIKLRIPDVLPGPGDAHQLDALDLVERYPADVVYLDPPYNQHNYLRNYHVWETLVRWDAPEVYGIACKRTDCRERRSDFNSKVRIREALAALIEKAQARWLIVSFNNEGYIDREEMTRMLSTRGEVDVQEIAYGRYVGAKIGIYNPKGEKVGRVSHLRNIEYMFRVRCA
jgi:adenine-specific DNA-methyltransferase